MTKNCTKCKQVKDASLFSKCPRVRSGLRSSCKACDSIKFKSYRERFPEKDRERHKKIYASNPKKQIEKAKIWRKNNREKFRVTRSIWEKNNPEKVLSMRLKTAFGIDLNKYNSMSENQAHKCAICGVHKEKLNRALCVDHCHKTGLVRGLLCQTCNTGIGHLKDSPDIVRNALVYLEAIR